jgi:nucleoside-diphosphate-sugar epimerase
MAQSMNILVTGAAGFIGWKVCEFLLTKPSLIPDEIKANNILNIIGVDNLNDYYDVRLKQWRLDQLKQHKNFMFYKLDIEHYDDLKVLFDKYKFNAVINLAARAGVRYSMENPFVYYTTNVIGTLNLLELCREYKVNKFVLASTSSLYAGQKMPFNEDLPVNKPISPYAASKKGAEATSYTYHFLYNMDISILRYFTVYGPAGRPDMSIFRFIYWMDHDIPIIIYGDGSQSRDFTYVEDIARGSIQALKPLGFEIINLGGDEPHKLLDVLSLIEKNMNKKAEITYKPFHPADMMATWADVSRAKSILDWTSTFSVGQGINETIKWYFDYRNFAAGLKLD